MRRASPKSVNEEAIASLNIRTAARQRFPIIVAKTLAVDSSARFCGIIDMTPDDLMKWLSQ